MIPAPPLPPLSLFEAAARRLAGRVRRTPVHWSPWLSEKAGREVYLKLESLQLTGSFKLRGAFNAALAVVERAAPDGARPRLVTASAGNHGRGLAFASRALGLELVVFTPRGAPAVKLDAIRRLGADLRAVAADYDEAERMARAESAATGAAFVSPYNDLDVIAGAGTVALELVADLPDLGTVVVPVGGGGLACGVGSVMKHLVAGVEVVGVEVEASHPFTDSLAAGRIVEIEVGPSLADGLVGNLEPGSITFDIARRAIDRIVVVGESALAEAMRGLVTEEHVTAEGAGAASVAAVLSGLVRVGRPRAGKRAACLVSGANVDAGRLAALLAGQPV